MKYSSSRISVSAFGIGVLLITLLISMQSISQVKHQTSGVVKIIIKGTSNIHDWDMKSDKGVCNGVLEVNNLGSLHAVSTLNFTVPAESLKSEHSGMDKNTYKALKTGKYPSISFVAASIEVKSAGTTNYILTAKGKLTIAGVSRDVVLTANGVVNPDKSISYSGSYQLKMTDYNVDPPTALLGTIRTGDKVTVKFNLVLKNM